MKKYQNHQRLTRTEQQQITGGSFFSSTTCFVSSPVHGSYTITVNYRTCNPSLCCSIEGAYGYTCGGNAAILLDCGGEF
jgi:hypothetical protein